MATTRKSTKGKVRKKSRRYMKKAARRTIAALLMITALVVAAIPATPGRAAETGKYDGSYDYAYNDTGNRVVAYFTLVSTNYVYVGFDSATVSSDYSIINVSDNNLSPIELVDPMTDFKTGDTFVCSVIGQPLHKKNKITAFTCDTLESVAAYAFQDAENIGRFSSGSVKEIGGHAFERAVKLGQVIAPSVTSIGDYAFISCNNLDNFTVPTTSMKRIGSYAFDQCTSLESFKLPEVVEEAIGDNAFSECTKLKASSGSFYVPGNGSEDSPMVLGKEIFKNCSSLDNVVLRDTVGSIGKSDFEGCGALSNVELGKYTSSIGERAFYNCNELKTLTTKENLTSIAGDAFFGCVKLDSIVLPDTFKKIEKGTFVSCNSLNYIDLDNWKKDVNTVISDQSLPASPKDNFCVKGYRYIHETGEDGKPGEIAEPRTYTEAYKYCLKNNIKYSIKDNSGIWAKNYFDVTTAGKLVNCDVESYLLDYYGVDDISKIATSANKIIVPSSVEGTEIRSVATDAFAEVKGGSISINEIDFSIENPPIEEIDEGAFYNIKGLEKVIFDEKNDKIHVSGDSSSPTFSKTTYVVGSMVDTPEGVTYPNLFDYAVDNGIEFRSHDLDTSDIVYVIDNKDKELRSVIVNDIKKSVSLNQTNYHMPQGIKSIVKSMFANDGVIKSITTEGLQKLYKYQFQADSNLTNVEINGKFLAEAFEELPFKSCRAIQKISISDENGVYSVDSQGIIYEKNEDENRIIVEAIENQIASNAKTVYKVEEDVVDMRDEAFWDNQWITIFDNVYNDTTHATNLINISDRAFYNAPNLRLVNIGYNSKRAKVGDDAFKHQDDMDDKMVSPIAFYVYNPSVRYADAFPKKASDSVRVYNFYSKLEDDTYALAYPNDKKDNLFWYELEDVVTDSLEGAWIDYPRKVISDKDYSDDYKDYDINQLRYYTGESISLNAGQNSRADFILYDKNNNAIDPSKYVVKGLDNVKAIGSYPFYIEGNGKDYAQTPTVDGTFVVVREGSGGGGALDGFEITFANGNTDFDYTGSDIPITALSSTAATGNDGEFYVWDRSSGKVLINGTDYTYSPQKVKDVNTYTLTVTGAGTKYAGGVLTKTFKVGSGTPEPTPPTPGSLVLRKITYPETSDGGQTRLYNNGREYVMSPGYDFIVYGSDDKVVDPGEYEVKSDYTTDGKNLVGVKGDPEKTVEIPFTVETPGSASSNYAKSSLAGKFIIIPKEENDGDFNIKLPGIDDLGFAEWTGGVIEPEPVVYLKNDSSTILEVMKDYTVGYPDTDDDTGPNNKDMGTNKGVVYVYGAGSKYSGKSGRRYFSIRKSIPYYVDNSDSRKKITFTVTNGIYYDGTGSTETKKESGDSYKEEGQENYVSGRVSATVELVDATTGKKLVEGTDYTLSFKKEKGMNATVAVTGMGNYFGTYTSAKFPLKKESKSSSSSSSGGSSSSSTSSSSSSSSRSSSGSSSSGGSSSGSTGSGSSGGGGNRNSGTTVENRNYYGPNGGTVDELQDMLRAAHIDSINGGTADGYQVNITKSDEAEAAFRDALIRRYGSLDNIRYFSMDISVRDENGNAIDTSGMSVTLTLPLPTSMQQYGTNNKVATVDSGGDLEDLNEQFSTLEGRPCVTFVAPHFSPYGFYVNTADLAVGTLDNTPKTGDPIHPKWFLSFGLAALSIFLFLKRDPKPQANPA
ncbi:MAG: leucine-rich repeat protein [Lachnospiraceae bacterium]|nr:leucine-rich repeat protein [Lachnospiraceae bacterium]